MKGMGGLVSGTSKRDLLRLSIDVYLCVHIHIYTHLFIYKEPTIVVANLTGAQAIKYNLIKHYTIKVIVIKTQNIHIIVSYIHNKVLHL